MNTVLSVKETAAFLGISLNFAYDLIRRGEIPALRLGKRIIVSRATLEQMLAHGGIIVSA